LFGPGGSRPLQDWSDSTTALRRVLRPQCGREYNLKLSQQRAAAIRQGKSEEAIDELRRASKFAPDQAQFAYVYAVGLHSARRVDEAITVLESSMEKHPTDRNSLHALATFYRDAGNFAAALDYAKRLAAVAPGDRQISDLIDALARRIRESKP